MKFRMKEVGELPPTKTKRPEFEFPKKTESGNWKYPEAKEGERPEGAKVEQPSVKQELNLCCRCGKPMIMVYQCNNNKCNQSNCDREEEVGK